MAYFGTRALTMIQQNIEDIKDRMKRQCEMGDRIAYDYDDEIEKVEREVAALGAKVHVALHEVEERAAKRLSESLAQTAMVPEVPIQGKVRRRASRYPGR